MAKLRATSIQDSLTITITNESAKGLILSDGSNNNAVNFKNNNGILNISFTGLPGGANPSINAEDCNVNIGKTLSAENIILQAGGINISNSSNNNSIDIFKTVESYTPDVTTKNVSMQRHDGIRITVTLVPENTSNSIFSSIGINTYNHDGSSYSIYTTKALSKVTYNWALLVKDNNKNEEKITFSVTLNAVNTTGQTSQVYDKFTIEKKNLSMHFRGTVTVALISSNDGNMDDRERLALQKIYIDPTFNIRNYVQNNVLIGSASVNKSELYETVGIGNNISPSDDYPLDIAAGGNHLKMDSEGALNFGKVIINTSTSIKEVTLNKELGVFIINFKFANSDSVAKYTAILSRYSLKGFETYAATNGKYKLGCDEDGMITVYNNSGSEDEVSGVYIDKIIKIMSY